jgi:hypothetical protein
MVTTDTFTVEGLKGIKYAVVEATAKADKGLKITGYFLGIRNLVTANKGQLVNKDDLFLWLMKGETVQILNLEHYDIHSLDISLQGSSTKYSVYNQEICIQRLEAIQKAMKAYDMMRPNGLIDTDKFTGVSTTVKNAVEDDVKTKRSSVTNPVARSGYNPTNYNSGYNPNSYHTGSCHTHTYKKKEISTAVIKRTSKYPIASAIEKMRLKIESIKDGTYKAPKLSTIPADKEKSKEVSNEEEKSVEKETNKTTEQEYWEEMYGHGAQNHRIY